MKEELRNGKRKISVQQIFGRLTVEDARQPQHGKRHVAYVSVLRIGEQMLPLFVKEVDSIRMLVHKHHDHTLHEELDPDLHEISMHSSFNPEGMMWGDKYKRYEVQLLTTQEQSEFGEHTRRLKNLRQSKNAPT